MSSEYLKHRQCQICLDTFKESGALHRHIEEYKRRERLLVAELERCRMHIPRSHSDDNEGEGQDSEQEPHAIQAVPHERAEEWGLTEERERNEGHETDEECEGAQEEEEDEGRESRQGGQNDCPKPTQLTPFRCPLRACEREKPFTDQSNLTRHFQQHVSCMETCVFCKNVFTIARKFIRHRCKADLDPAKQEYMQSRIAKLNGTVRAELKKLRGSQRRGTNRAQKITKTKQKDKPSRRRLPWTYRQRVWGTNVHCVAVSSGEFNTTSEIDTVVAQGVDGCSLDTSAHQDDCLYAFDPDMMIDDYGLFAYEGIHVDAC